VHVQCSAANSSLCFGVIFIEELRPIPRSTLRHPPSADHAISHSPFACIRRAASAARRVLRRRSNCSLCSVRSKAKEQEAVAAAGEQSMFALIVDEEDDSAHRRLGALELLHKAQGGVAA
jgi:hypothetical protein